MWTRLWLFVEQHSRTVIIVLPGIAFALGVVGWMTSSDMDWWTAAYRSMALFALDGPTGGEISWQLAWARFLAPITISLAIIAVALEMLRAQFSKGRAKRQRGHTVVLGAGAEAMQLARRVRESPGSGPVVSVGALPPQDVAELRRAGVIHLPTPEPTMLAKVLGEARLVVISAPDDNEAMTLTDQVRRLTSDADAKVVTLLSDRELAADWRYTGTGTVLCRATRVASAVLRGHPPYLEDAVSPPPTVIGEGALAAELVQRITGGWQRPGERLTVYCAGTDPSWIRAAQIGLPVEVNLEWCELYPNGRVAAQVVRESLAKWRQSWGGFSHNGRYRTAPARVYVAFEDDTLTMPIANAIARELRSDIHVVAVLGTLASAVTRHPGVRVVGRLELLCEPGDLRRSTADDLADEIVADLGRWPADVPSAFGPIAHEAGRVALLGAQDTPVREAIVAVAERAESILRSAGFEVTAGSVSRPEALVLDPAELVAIADDLAGLVPRTPAELTPGYQHVRLLELASSLPTLLRRVGRSVTRVDARPDRLLSDDVMALAMSAHKGYREVASVTRNATGSVFANAEWEHLTEHERRSNVAQVWDIPVKLAAIGCDWEVATPQPAASVAFTDAAIELLAELEHRRWAHFEMRNARHDHQWNKPWAVVKETAAAEYDRTACARIPGHLAQVGIRIKPPDERPPGAPADVLGRAVEPADREEDEVTPVPRYAPDPRRFKRRGRAWAWRLDEPFEWRSPRGDNLQARAGDWWVIDEQGASRTIGPESFTATYQQVRAQEYRRIGVVTAWQASEPQTVTTREGEALAEPGDWIVTDAAGASWPVPQDEFGALYEEDR